MLALKVLDIKVHILFLGKSALLTGLLEMEKKVSFEKNPLVTNRPYLVLDSSEITLFRSDGVVSHSQEVYPLVQENCTRISNTLSLTMLLILQSTICLMLFDTALKHQDAFSMKN